MANAENYFGNLTAPIQPLSVFDQAFSSIPVSSFLAGVDTTGAQDSLGTLNSLFSATAAVFLSSPPNGYVLSANFRPAAKNIVIEAAGNVYFTGGKIDYNDLIPYEASPGTLYAQYLNRKVYDSNWAGYGNIFHVSAYAQAAVSNVPVVALYSQGEATAANSRAWGINPAGIASNATGTAITVEADPVVTVAGGTAYGVVVASSASVAGGVFPNGFQMDANSYNARFIDGAYFHFSDTIASGDTNPRGLLNNAVINIVGGGGIGSVCSYLLRDSGVSTTSATIDFPALLVDACTVTTVANRPRLTNGTTGVGPIYTVSGTDTNADVNMKPKGTGAVVLLDGSSNKKLSVNATGVGLYTAAPVAQATTAGASATFVANGGTAINTLSTFDGYTIPQIVKALRNLGALQ